jgi:hypothetical protein
MMRALLLRQPVSWPLAFVALGVIVRVAAAAPGDLLHDGEGGCVPETAEHTRCAGAVAKRLARLVADVAACHGRRAALAMAGRPFDVQGCEQAARTRFDDTLVPFGVEAGCPATVVSNAAWVAAAVMRGKEVPHALGELSGSLFCDGTSGVPLDAAGEDSGFVPSRRDHLRCGRAVARNVVRFRRRLLRCRVRAARAGFSERAFNLDGCESGPNVGARAIYDAAARNLARLDVCPPCLDRQAQDALGDRTAAWLEEVSALLLACEVRHLRVAFRDAACPSSLAPPGCGAGTAATCHEAWAGPTCTTGHGQQAFYFLPEDGPADGGGSRAWSFAIRPQARLFYGLYPEATGSVRVTADGAGGAGTRTGASDQAHLRLSIGFPASRLLVLRWFTGGLPPGADGRLQLRVGPDVMLDTSESPGPAVRGMRIWPVTWAGDLDLTVSAAVSGARDQPTPSADLLWHLAVLRPNGDDDRDGTPNAEDTDPLDGSVPGPRPPSGRPRVLLLGLDGVGWDVLRPLVDAGFLPTIGGLVEGGAIAGLDETPNHPTSCCFCPPVWSSIATGQPAPAHHMDVIRSEPADRPVPSVWQVLARHRGTSTQINYRNTFPPEPGTTYAVTEPATFTTAFEDFFTTWGGGVDVRSDNVNRLQFTWPPLLLESLGLLPHAGPRPEVWISFGQDRIGSQALQRIVMGEQTDLTAWILHSPDKAEHVLWHTVQSSPTAPVNQAALLQQAQEWTGPIYGGVWTFGSVASQILEADLLLSELLSRVSYDYIVITSDHAMTRNDPGGSLPGIHHRPGPGGQAFTGIFVLWGAGIRAGLDLGTVSLLDVAPTVAYLLDLPVADDLPGRLVRAAVTTEHLAAQPVRIVPSWIE